MTNNRDARLKRLKAEIGELPEASVFDMPIDADLRRFLAETMEGITVDDLPKWRSKGGGQCRPEIAELVIAALRRRASVARTRKFATARELMHDMGESDGPLRSEVSEHASNALVQTLFRIKREREEQRA